MDYCPKCQKEQNLRSSEEEREKKVKGKKKKVIIRSYHCEVCNTFIKSEKIDYNP
ncbi:MAG: hypothetical protein JW827_04605 [Spirochaetes bacterium]|nr:hypothetical protein [Spirochaetota bacterium]